MERETEKVTIQPPYGVKELLIDYSKPLLKEMPQGYITIPKGATNGDMIKKMFPNLICVQENKFTYIYKNKKRFESGVYSIKISNKWWNAPYEIGEVEDEQTER